MSCLELNVGKTKEFICGKSRVGSTPRATCLSQQEVEIVSSFNYLGTVWRVTILSHGMATSVTVKHRSNAKLSRIVSIASKTVVSQQVQLSHLYQLSVKRKTHQTLNDTSPPLNVCFESLPSDHRFRVPLARSISWCFTSTETNVLFGMGKEWDREWEPRPTSLFTQLLSSDT